MFANPTTAAAAIAGAATVIGAMFAYRIKLVTMRNDYAAQSLLSQIQGWDNYTKHLLKRVADLEEDIQKKDEDCDRRIKYLDDEMKRRDSECQRKISDLEQRLRGLGI